MVTPGDLEGGLDTDPGPSAAVGVMKALLLDVDAPLWESFLHETPHDFYHLPGYVALSAARELGRPRALHVADASRSMLLPLIIRDVPGSDGSDAISPYGYPGPLVAGTMDAEFLREALTVGMSALRSAGVVSAFLRLHPLLNAPPPEGIGWLVHHGDTVSIDLTLSWETLWAQTRHNHRRDISRAVESGCVSRMDPTFEQYPSFKHLYQVTMDRLSAAPYYFFDDAYFDGLRDVLGERLHLCVVEKGEAIAAAGLFVETGGIVQYHLMGTDDAFAQTRPAKLMLDFVRRWAKERGNHCMHLGGGVGGRDDSLLHFKLGFSPVRQPFYTLRIVIDEPEYTRLVVACDPLLDPEDLGGFFPAYRSA